MVPVKIESFPMILIVRNMGNMWTTRGVVPLYGSYLDERILRERRPLRKRVSPIKMVRYSEPVVLESPPSPPQPEQPEWPAPPPSPPPEPPQPPQQQPPPSPPQPQPPQQQPVEFKEKAMRIIHEVSRRRQLFNQGTLLQRRE